MLLAWESALRGARCLFRYYAREEGPGTAVFVRALPAEVNAEKLAAAFAQFGALRGGAAAVALKVAAWGSLTTACTPEPCSLCPLGLEKCPS